MKLNILHFKIWFEQRLLRERMLVLLLGWAFLYALFYFFLFRSLDYQQAVYEAEIKQVNSQIISWKKQMLELNKVANSPLYKKWMVHMRSFQLLRQKYQTLLQNTSAKDWQSIIRALLQSQNNIRLEGIKNLPETAYNPLNTAASTAKIYQQQFTLIIDGNYFDTISYLQQLEKALPNIRWDSLDYQVIQYPLAKVEMEFSILYEKTG